MISLNTLSVLYLGLLINTTLSHFMDPATDLTHLQETNGIRIKAEKNRAFTSPVVAYKLHYYSKRNGIKHREEIRRNKSAANEKAETSKIKESTTKFQSKFSTAENKVIGCVLLLLGTLSLLGNCCTFIIFHSQNKHLSSVELLIVHLAIVDIMTTFATYPLPIIATFKHGWYFGEIGCTYHAFVSEFLTASSVLSITLIAVFRCLKTCVLSLGYRVTCWTSYKVLVLSNVLSFLWAVTPLLGVGKYEMVPFGLECGVSWIARDAGSQLRLGLESVFGVFLPLAIILFCYFRIIKTVNRSSAQLQSRHFRRRNSRITVGQLTFIGTLVGLGFAITRIPITITLLMSSFRGEVIFPIWITLIPVLLAKSSAALNPFIYVLSTKRYRKRLSGLMYKCIRLKTGNESTKRVSFTRTDFSNRKNSISKGDVNGKVVLEMCINSSGVHEIYRGQRTFEFRNGERYLIELRVRKDNLL